MGLINRYVRLLITCIMLVPALNGNIDTSHLIPIDKIEVVIFGDEDTAVITTSDLGKLTLEGRPRTLPDTLFEQLVNMDAKKFKITSDEDSIDRYLAMIMREHNMSQKDLINMFNTAGYTYEEGREQLGLMFSINTMLDFKIKSRLIIPEAKIVAYYNEHPQIEEDMYRLQRIVVPAHDDETVDDIKNMLDRCERLGREISGIQRSTAFWVKRSEIAADKLFVMTMRPGTISAPVAVKDGFECFKLLERREQRTVPLEDRYRHISEELKKPLFDKLLEEYKTSLFESASILYF